MATDAQDDLSASVYIGHKYVVKSRVVHKGAEGHMENEKTGFVTEAMTETGNTTLTAYSETPYRGGFIVTIVLS